MRSLVEQIRDAQEQKGWSVQRLLDESGLDIDRSVLQRKLTEAVPMTSEECEALAEALGINLVFVPEAS